MAKAQFSRMGREAQRVQIWIQRKIKLRKMENFQTPKSVRQHTTIYQQSTTNSPSKNHVLHTIFLENPCKNTTPPEIKKSRPQREFSSTR
jgi:hypothetical protein